MKKRFIIPTMIAASVITACGGGGSASPSDNLGDSGITEPTNKSITVIDGYLQNVSVYADRNMDNMASDDELVGVTDENGQITLQLADESYNLIAKVVASEAVDSDRIGTVTRSFSLSAPMGSDVITPFTTLYTDENISADDIAATFNIATDIITGDYVAQKNEHDDAIIAHALARSLIVTLAQQEQGETTQAIIEKAVEIKAEIDDFISTNGLEALDEVTVAYEGGEVQVEKNYTDLNEYLTSEERWNLVSLNPARLAEYEEGVQYIEFNGETSTYQFFDRNGQLKFESSYKVDGLSLISDGETMEPFLVLTRDIAIHKASGAGDINIWSKDQLAYPFVAESFAVSEFAGNEWYVIWDDSTSKEPEHSLATFTFSDADENGNGTVEINESGEGFETTYSISQKEHEELGSIVTLTVTLDDSRASLEYLQISASESVKIFFELNRKTYHVFTDEKAIAYDVVSAF